MLNYASRGCWRGIAEGRVFSSRFWCVSISLPFALPKGYQWCCMGASWVHTFPWWVWGWPLHCSPPDLDTTGNWFPEPHLLLWSHLTASTCLYVGRLFSAQGLSTLARGNPWKFTAIHWETTILSPMKSEHKIWEQGRPFWICSFLAYSLTLEVLFRVFLMPLYLFPS